MTIKITGLQQAQDALKKELDKLRGGKFALVGIHESAGSTADGELTMAQLGAIQHFGNDKIPARPWLDIGVEQGAKEYIETIKEGIADGLTGDQILEQVGNLAVGYVQQYVVDLKDPPNAQSTIDKKGSSNPLIDTGAMNQSITYTIAGKKPEEGLA